MHVTEQNTPLFVMKPFRNNEIPTNPYQQPLSWPGPSERGLVAGTLRPLRHRLRGDGALFRRRPGAHRQPAQVYRQPRFGVRLRRDLGGGEGQGEPGGHHRPRRSADAGEPGDHGRCHPEGAPGVRHSVLLRLGVELQDVREVSGDWGKWGFRNWCWCVLRFWVLRSVAHAGTLKLGSLRSMCTLTCTFMSFSLNVCICKGSLQPKEKFGL